MSAEAPDPWDDARWERKCALHLQWVDELLIWIDQQPYAFGRAFPNRTVRSLYFDSAMLDDFVENLAGTSVRKKLRLRWYDDDSRRATLEVKSKRNQLGVKHSFKIELPQPLEDLEFTDLPGILAAQLPEHALPLLTRGAVPAALITYDRRYFVSADGRIRVTLDENIQTWEQLGCRRLNDRRPDAFPHVVVLEIKYAAEFDSELRSMLGFLPGRISRFSKYAIGLQALLDV